MNRYKMLTGALLAVAVVFVGLTLRTSDKDKPFAAQKETAGDGKADVRRLAPPRPGIVFNGFLTGQARAQTQVGGELKTETSVEAGDSQLWRGAGQKRVRRAKRRKCAAWRRWSTR